MSGLDPLDVFNRLHRDFPKPLQKRIFVEFLGLPARDQREAKKWVRLRIDAKRHAGWYGLPCFRFMGLAAIGRLESRNGIAYGAPHMMALANLLSHEVVGTQRMSMPIGGRPILRSAKDLGRVLAIARLSNAEEVSQWARPWQRALKICFPKSWRSLSRGAGTGLRALMDDANAFSEAHHTTSVGLLRGQDVTEENLRAVAEQLFATALEPLRSAGT